MQHVQLGLIGDDGSGKTSFFMRWKNGSAPDPSNLSGPKASVVDASEFSQFKRTVNVDGRDVEVTLWDLEGARDIGRVRCLVYPNLGGVLVLFGLDNEASLEATGSVWPKDLDPNWFSPDKPRLLVGTKLDLRESGSATITASKAKKQMGPLKASSYHEVSAKTGAGVDETIQQAVRACLNGAAPSGGCCIVS